MQMYREDSGGVAEAVDGGGGAFPAQGSEERAHLTRREAHEKRALGLAFLEALRVEASDEAVRRRCWMHLPRQSVGGGKFIQKCGCPRPPSLKTIASKGKLTFDSPFLDSGVGMWQQQI